MCVCVCLSISWENQPKREKEIEDKKKCFQMGTHHQIIEGKRERILRMAISQPEEEKILERFWMWWETLRKNMQFNICKPPERIKIRWEKTHTTQNTKWKFRKKKNNNNKNNKNFFYSIERCQHHFLLVSSR